ncbi:hypothetical protein [Pedobacter antarcticus]|uniref:hypothetical protein n=1 Tax=Pedobacter antarcticus TaxID=34086 RepID=UPI002930B3B6|nr:hypothetical protein [Pedobacter antarcticus]
MKQINNYRSWFNLMLLATCLTFGCKKNIDEIKQESGKISSIDAKNRSLKLSNLSVQRSDELMEGFSLMLRDALADDVELRRFLKNEALKKFDLDYDILYGMIKDKTVSNNQTFREKLLKYVNSEQELFEFEESLPLLTIYVPEIPNFSAEKWNAESEKPAVSTGIINKNKMVTYYLNDGEQEEKLVDLVPGFPLLVIKNNERVVLSEHANELKITNTSRITTASNNYVFTSENFNGLSENQKTNSSKVGGGATTNSTCLNCSLDDKLSTAFDLWQQYGTNNIWQRDYIYYSITPNSPNGPLDTRYQETITALKFKTGKEAYDKISDQSEDPYAIHDPNSPTNSPTASWTEGSFEFKVTVLINNTQGLGTVITKLFPVSPSRLFFLRYVAQGNNYYTLSITPIQCDLNEVVAAWDIKNNGVAWKVTLSEADASSTITTSQTNTSQFATNFGFDLSKIGLKFGTSSTTTSVSNYSIATQVGDDQLGEGAIYFYDPVVISWDIIPGVGAQSYTFKDIDTGWALLTIQPKKVF